MRRPSFTSIHLTDLSRNLAFRIVYERAFDDDDQKRLAAFVQEVNDVGAKFILSNSDPKNTVPDDEFFDNSTVVSKSIEFFAIVRSTVRRANVVQSPSC